LRSVTVDRRTKEVPFLHVKGALNQMGWTKKMFDYWKAPNC